MGMHRQQMKIKKSCCLKEKKKLLLQDAFEVLHTEFRVMLMIYSNVGKHHQE